MPIGIAARRTRLSPLEEEEMANRNSEVVTEGGAMCEGGRSDRVRGEGEEEGERTFISIGTAILTTRSYNQQEGYLQGGPKEGRDDWNARRSSLQDSEMFSIVCEESLLAMKSQMKYLWRQDVPMCIEVKGQAAPLSPGVVPQSILLEQWIVQVIPKRSSSAHTSPSLLLQAVLSFLHFSQIRSWIISQGGSLPFQLFYRVCAPGDDTGEQFSLCQPETHSFPPATLTPHSVLQVSTTYLPRLKQIPPLLLNSLATHLKLASAASRRTESSTDYRTRQSLSSSTGALKQSSSLSGSKASLRSPTIHSSRSYERPKARESAQDLAPVSVSLPKLVTTCSESLEQLSLRTARLALSASPHANGCSTPNGRSNTSDHWSHSNKHSCPSTTHPTNNHTLTQGSFTHQRLYADSVHTPAQDTAFPFSPPLPSPMSPKLLSGLSDQAPFKALLTAMRNGGGAAGEEEGGRRGSGTAVPTTTYLARNQQCIQREGVAVGEDHSCDHHFCFERTCIEQSGDRAVAQSREGLTRSQNVVIPRASRRELLPSDAQVKRKDDSWAQVRPPAASSPVPFAMQRSCSTCRPTDSSRRRSCAINIKSHPPRPPVRSNSAPAAVPSLYLLGTFEESVLNGRLEPCGFVDGFTAELGASGTFCPSHVTLPVTATFFSLSDYGGTSPYFGHINLSGVGRRGYHVPKKGTVQVTLFNPNKTVVKIFVVTYDFSDMPQNSQTFLRQRTLSRPYHVHDTGMESLPVLHYLIHLRFLCSKSGRVYLHTDIRLIFARRAPDTDPDLSKVILFTVMEGPSDPKYGPLNQLSRKQ